MSNITPIGNKGRLTLDKLIEFADYGGSRVFLKTGQITRPIFHAVDDKGEHFVVSVPDAIDDKDIAASMIRVLFDLRNVVQCVTVMEAWTLSAIGKDHTEERVRSYSEAERTGTVSSHPERRECINYIAEDADAGTVMGERLITRRSNGKPRLGALTIFPQEGVTRGRFVGMLPVRGTKQ